MTETKLDSLLGDLNGVFVEIGLASLLISSSAESICKLSWACVSLWLLESIHGAQFSIWYCFLVHTNGISLPSFNVKLGRYGSCLGAVPEASGANDEPMEFIMNCGVLQL